MPNSRQGKCESSRILVSATVLFIKCEHFNKLFNYFVCYLHRKTIIVYFMEDCGGRLLIKERFTTRMLKFIL